MAENETTEAPKKNRKLNKAINDETGIITIEAIGGAKGPVEFDFNKVNEKVQRKLGLAGLSHKLGDAASAVRGVEAEAAISRVWEGLLKGEWTTRGPATPKVALSEIAGNMAKLPKDQQKKAREALAALGIDLAA